MGKFKGKSKKAKVPELFTFYFYLFTFYLAAWRLV